MNKSNNIYRYILQYSILALLLYMLVRPYFDPSYLADFEAYCPFGGLQALGSYLLNQALSCTMTSAQIVMGVILFIGVLLLSKLFDNSSEGFSKIVDNIRIRLCLFSYNPI